MNRELHKVLFYSEAATHIGNWLSEEAEKAGIPVAEVLLCLMSYAECKEDDWKGFLQGWSEDYIENKLHYERFLERNKLKL